MKYGYQRVSTSSQNLDRQTTALEAAKCDKIFTDKASGKNTKDRPGLDEALSHIQKGDTLVIAEWDRATRSLFDGIDIMKKINDRGGSILILDKQHLDTTSTVGRGVIALLSALAEDERERIVKRSIQGLEAAKARGKKLGPKYKLTDEERAIALELFTHKDRTQRKSAREIAESFGVSPSTIARLRRK